LIAEWGLIGFALKTAYQGDEVGAEPEAEKIK